jgi:hypothetical protein
VKILQFPFKLTTGIAIILSSIIILVAMVTWLAARETIATIAPIAVWSLFGIILIVFAIIGMDRVQWFLLRRAEFRRDQAVVRSAGRQAKLQADREQMKLMFEGRMMAATVRQAEQGLLHAGQVGGVGMSVFPRQAISQVETQAQIAAPIDNSLVYEDVARKALASRGAGRFIAFGGMGSGKTTIAKHTVRLASDIIGQQGGQIFIIDPHAPEVIWGDNITVVGAGMDYASIRSFLDHVRADVKARYAAGCGDDTKPLPEPYKPNFIICEEWTGIIFALRAMKLWSEEDIKTFYMDARKAGWGYLLVAHEHTTKALGLDRLGNLLSGVEYFITLDRDAITECHSATLGRSFKDKDAYPLITPGPFNGPLFYSKVEAEAERSKTDKYLTFGDLSFVVAEPEPTADEAKAIDAYKVLRSGKVQSSWNAVVKSAYGDDKTGKFYHDKLKKTLDKFGVEYQ